MHSQPILKFDKQFLRDFWQLLKPYWVSAEKWSALALLALNVFCTIAAVEASVALNNFNKDFFDALQNFNKPALFTCLLQFAVLITVIVLSYGYAFYFNGLLGLRWRRWLTKHYLQLWLSNHAHYRAQLENVSVDNPDQRISEDLSSFPSLTLTITFIFFQAALSLLSFGYVLCKLSYFLFFSALLYGIFGTWITSKIGRKLAGFDYEQQHYNADFRFSLMRTREASEQIALYKGEAAENKKFNHLFNRIFDNFVNMIQLRKRLTFFTNGFNFLSYFLGIFLAIPLYWQKKIQLGGMMQISGAFGYVIAAFSKIVDGFSLFAEWRAVVSRLTEFNYLMTATNQLSSNIVISEHDKNDIILQNLKLTSPNGHLLLSNLDFTFHAGGTFLLCGPSGLGKSTLLRALAKIWVYGEGEIKLPKNKKIFFLPQKSYLPLGSLRDVLLYPHLENINDQALLEALEHAELHKLMCQLDEIKNWSHELSVGEQQLIAFARVFLHRPDIIFLDESTSALDEKTEKKLYETLKRLMQDGTLISVGHRPSLKQFHEQIVTLSKEGCLALLPAESTLQSQFQSQG